MISVYTEATTLLCAKRKKAQQAPPSGCHKEALFKRTNRERGSCSRDSVLTPSAASQTELSTEASSVRGNRKRRFDYRIELSLLTLKGDSSKMIQVRRYITKPNWRNDAPEPNRASLSWQDGCVDGDSIDGVCRHRHVHVTCPYPFFSLVCGRSPDDNFLFLLPLQRGSLVLVAVSFKQLECVDSDESLAPIIFFGKESFALVWRLVRRSPRGGLATQLERPRQPPENRRQLLQVLCRLKQGRWKRLKEAFGGR